MKLRSILDSIKSELSLSRFSTIPHDASSPTAGEAQPDTGSGNPLIDRRPVDSSNSVDSHPGRFRWGDLEILEELGRGAFGTVHRAWDPVLRRDVALKIFAVDQGQIEEARKLAKVNSPHIVKIFRYETHGGRPGLAMELIQGTTLARRIEVGGPLSCREAAVLGVDLCRAVSAVHAAAMIHRDIKAQNVMLEDSGRVVLMDFGLGENIGNEAAMRSLAGTLPYMAPELFSGGEASIRSDVYSLGVLLYYLASGKYPVRAESISGFREAHLSGRGVPLSKRSPAVRPGFARIVEQATAADPTLRYQSAEDMAAALARWLHRRPVRNGLLMAGALTALIAASMGFLARPPAVPEYSLTKITKYVQRLSDEPSISADGKLVAYTSDASGAGNLDIWVNNIEGSAARRITSSPHSRAGIDDPGGNKWSRRLTNESEPALSPDGKQVAYRSDRWGGAIYIQNLENGRERLLACFGHNPVFSPDGTEIAFWTGQSARFVNPLGRIYLVSALEPASEESGTEESAGTECVVRGAQPRQIATQFKDARLPAWSPDGTRILFQGCGPGCEEPERDSDWWTIQRGDSKPIKTGALQDVFLQGLTLYPGPPCWHDNNIIFSARVEQETNLWQIPIAKPFWLQRRLAVRLTRSTEDGVNPWVSQQGTIVFGGLHFDANLWKAPVAGVGKARQINNNFEADSMPSISADGKRILYFRRIGNSRKMVLWEPDQREILSVDVPSGTRGVIAASGELLAYSVPATSGKQIFLRRSPSWSPVMVTANGGEALDFFDAERRLMIATNDGVAVLDLTTGQQTPVLKNGSLIIDQAAVSPDGRWIAFLGVQDSDHSSIFVAPMSLSLIPKEAWHAVTKDPTWYDRPRWTRDGRSLVFLSKSDGFSCLWKQALDDHMQAATAPRPIHHMHEARSSPIHLSRVAFNLSVSRDIVLFNVGELQGNIWMARK